MGKNVVQSLKENETLKSALHTWKKTKVPVAIRSADTGMGIKIPHIEHATVGEIAENFARVRATAKEDAYQLAKGNGGSGVKGTGEGSKSTSGNSKHLSDVKIPSVRNNEFNKWFDNLSAKEFEEMWNNPQLRSKIEDRIRRPGGYHEWHLVARTPKFKQWGISMDDIKEMRSLTKDVEFVNPPGRHGRRGSTKAHNEMLKIIDSASDYESFVKGLNEWAENRMKNGIMDLPEGLRR